MSTKLRWSTLTLLVVLTAGLVLAGQNSAPQTPQQGHEAMGAAASSPDAHLQMLTEKLNLTDEQKTAKMKAIHASFHDQINAVLTPEQQTKLKEMRHEGAEKHRQ